MMNAWERAIQFTLSSEGGYVHDPDDPGGETKYGIAKRYHPNVDIENLTIEQARAIYKREYWDAIGLDALPESIAIAVFDTAVNVGTRKAVKLLQEALDAFVAVKLHVDGVLGPKTILAVQCVQRADRRALTVQYLLMRQLHYRTQVLKHPKKQKYIRGWINRTMALFELVLTV